MCNFRRDHNDREQLKSYCERGEREKGRSPYRCIISFPRFVDVNSPMIVHTVRIVTTLFSYIYILYQNSKYGGNNCLVEYLCLFYFKYHLVYLSTPCRANEFSCQ